MTPIYTARFSTMMHALFRNYAPSLACVESLACDRCGLKLLVRGGAGISGYTFAIDYFPPNSLPFKVSAVATLEGSLLILCGCLPSDAPPLPIPTGDDNGISSLPANSEFSTFTNYFVFDTPQNATCSRCHERAAYLQHRLAFSMNVKPKFAWLCRICAHEIVNTGEIV